MKSILLPMPAPIWGGIHAVVQSLEAPLNILGYRQTVLVPDDASDIADRLGASGVQVIRATLPRFRRDPLELSRSVLRMPSALARLSELKDVQEADIIQAVGVHHPHAPYLARKLKKPLVWQLHSDSVSGILRSAARRYITKNSNGVIANSEKIGVTFLGEHFGKGNHGIFFPPIETIAFDLGQRVRHQARANLGISGDQVAVVTIGSRGWQKNHQMFIKAAELSIESGLPLKFFIFGPVVKGYSEVYEEEVIAEAQKLNSRRPGWVEIRTASFDQVKEALQAADIFALTSHAEGIPLVIAEAMASGTPIVSTNVGGISEILLQGTGHLIEPGDTPELSNCIFNLARHEKLRTTMGKKAKKAAQALFSADRAAFAHAEVYNRALEEVTDR